MRAISKRPVAVEEVKRRVCYFDKLPNKFAYYMSRDIVASFNRQSRGFEWSEVDVFRFQLFLVRLEALGIEACEPDGSPEVTADIYISIDELRGGDRVKGITTAGKKRVNVVNTVINYVFPYADLELSGEVLSKTVDDLKLCGFSAAFIRSIKDGASVYDAVEKCYPDVRKKRLRSQFGGFLGGKRA